MKEKIKSILILNLIHKDAQYEEVKRRKKNPKVFLFSSFIAIAK